MKLVIQSEQRIQNAIVKNYIQKIQNRTFRLLHEQLLTNSNKPKRKRNFSHNFKRACLSSFSFCDSQI